jgi:hypothetical protein
MYGTWYSLDENCYLFETNCLMFLLNLLQLTHNCTVCSERYVTLRFYIYIYKQLYLPDDLVQEYVGDVIDTATMKQHMAQWHVDHPNDFNFYIMALGGGWYIDARERGGLSRFINHSCAPNCKLVPTNVAGYMRIAIVALEDIPSGSFMSYDYQFDVNAQNEHDRARFVCRCGAPNCRGSLNKRSKKNKHGNGQTSYYAGMNTGGSAIGGTDTVDGLHEADDKSRRERLKEAKLQVDRDEKFVMDYKRAKPMRLSEVGLEVPGADHVGQFKELVCHGPQERYRHDFAGSRPSSHDDPAQESDSSSQDSDADGSSRLFLWRNVVRGSRSWQRRYKRWQELGEKRIQDKTSNKDDSPADPNTAPKSCPSDTLTVVQEWNVKLSLSVKESECETATETETDAKLVKDKDTELQQQTLKQPSSSRDNEEEEDDTPDPPPPPQGEQQHENEEDVDVQSSSDCAQEQHQDTKEQ